MRLAVISPFVDRRHGTERVLAEQLQRLSESEGFQIELYSQAVEGLDLATATSPSKSVAGRIVWHKIPRIFGPHLVRYFCWFLANSARRRSERFFSFAAPDITFSPGINAVDADVIAVHIVFHAFYDQVIGELRLANAPLRSWPRRLHRRLYYRCIMALENRIYRNPKVRLLPVSRLVAEQIRTYFGRSDAVVIPNGVSVERFHPGARLERRRAARAELGLSSEDFVLLLIGNDWVKKGLRALLQALAICENPNLRLLVVGNDDATLFAEELSDPLVCKAVKFLPPRDDVIFYYGAADAYVGPSLEDAFGLPILESMACGLPVVASAFAGASEAVQDGRNGFLLRDPKNSEELATKINLLGRDKSLRDAVGEAAIKTAREYSWERNAAQLRDVLLDAAKQKAARR